MTPVVGGDRKDDAGGAMSGSMGGGDRKDVGFDGDVSEEDDDSEGFGDDDDNEGLGHDDDEPGDGDDSEGSYGSYSYGYWKPGLEDDEDKHDENDRAEDNAIVGTDYQGRSSRVRRKRLMDEQVHYVERDEVATREEADEDFFEHDEYHSEEKGIVNGNDDENADDIERLIQFNKDATFGQLYGPKCGLSLEPACALLDRAAWECPPSRGDA
ncbi:hypothetical protein CRG98_005158 [Punica granatum]|uniref:Uncharacterized protein n=1 Tax=Punica granatum TaxID=22663 RepID=A0A2I0L2U9_PUNGR|nr:hypothetical protein CRG98_005158 [Punica granatum]